MRKQNEKKKLGDDLSGDTAAEGNERHDVVAQLYKFLVTLYLINPGLLFCLAWLLTDRVAPFLMYAYERFRVVQGE